MLPFHWSVCWSVGRSISLSYFPKSASSFTSNAPIRAIVNFEHCRLHFSSYRIYAFSHSKMYHSFTSSKTYHCQHSEIVYRYWPNHLPVLAKSSTGIGKIVYWYWEKANSFPWYISYQYMILPIPVCDFVNTGRSFRMSTIRICIIYIMHCQILQYLDDLANTCRRFGHYR